jgi:hypothetical protein
MPQILVIADTADDEPAVVQLREWVPPEALESDHYAAQLIERVRWAAADAAKVERDHG